ncbi:hypothetical protein OIU74_026712 [Salix koriyanagi]|uniref:Uncharacterized protein n=1 Tax=Salix koriyanagi TaxID=2511006 RepID=A0A9Q0VZ96_9ROSI|nr:hypothetical protein OIU74_026712 [Salix koriyanagi]
MPSKPILTSVDSKSTLLTKIHSNKIHSNTSGYLCNKVGKVRAGEFTSNEIPVGKIHPFAAINGNDNPSATLRFRGKEF